MKTLIILATLLLMQTKSGETNMEALKEYDWYQKGYESYEPDKKFIKQIKNASPEVELLVFGGDWCPDTHDLLPKFMKTVCAAGISEERTRIYLLDHNKKSPEGLEEKYNINWVPTFIFLKNGQEIGRITESAGFAIDKAVAKELH